MSIAQKISDMHAVLSHTNGPSITTAIYITLYRIEDNIELCIQSEIRLSAKRFVQQSVYACHI